jgi:hypothetical protein
LPNENERIQVFKTTLPSVYLVLKEIQSLNLNLPVLNNEDGVQKSFKNTSLMLQRTESVLIYQYLPPKLINEEIWSSTIQYCIISFEGFEVRVNQLFTDTFIDLKIPVPQIITK